MKKSFKRALSMILVAVMLALMIPTGFVVTASAGEYPDAHIIVNATEATAGTPTTRAGVPVYNNLSEALSELSKDLNKEMFKADTVIIHVETDTTEPSNAMSDHVKRDCSIYGIGDTAPKVAISSSAMSAWLLIGKGDASGVTVAIENLNIQRSDNKNIFSIRNNGALELKNVVASTPKRVIETSTSAGHNPTISIEGGCTLTSSEESAIYFNCGANNANVIEFSGTNTISTTSTSNSHVAMYILGVMDDNDSITIEEGTKFLSSAGNAINVISTGIVNFGSESVITTESAGGYAGINIGSAAIVNFSSKIVATKGNAINPKGGCTINIVDADISTPGDGNAINVADNAAKVIISGDTVVNSYNGYAVRYVGARLAASGTNKDVRDTQATDLLDITIYGGTFTNSGTNPVVYVQGKGIMNIYGGTFTAEKNNIMIAAYDMYESSEGTYGNYQDCKLYIYGGTFENKNTAEKDNFVIRPANGAVAYIYGGTFTTGNGSVLGAGTTSTQGTLYVYGGSFYKTENAGTDIYTHNGGNTAEGTKYLYFWGGEFRTAKTNDNRRYTAKSSGYSFQNRAIDYVNIVDINTAESGYAFADKITVKAPETGYAYDTNKAAVVGFEGYQLAEGVTAQSATADLRVIYNINADIADTYKAIGFWVSKTDANAIYYSEYADNSALNYAPAISTSTTEVVYSSLIANGQTVGAEDGQVFAMLEITDISNADFDTNIYVRAYAIDANGAIVYGDVMTVNVAAALND